MVVRPPHQDLLVSLGGGCEILGQVAFVRRLQIASADAVWPICRAVRAVRLGSGFPCPPFGLPALHSVHLDRGSRGATFDLCHDCTSLGGIGRPSELRLQRAVPFVERLTQGIAIV